MYDDDGNDDASWPMELVLAGSALDVYHEAEGGPDRPTVVVPTTPPDTVVRTTVTTPTSPRWQWLLPVTVALFSMGGAWSLMAIGLAIPCAAVHVRMAGHTWRASALTDTREAMAIAARCRRLRFELALVSTSRFRVGTSSVATDDMAERLASAVGRVVAVWDENNKTSSSSWQWLGPLHYLLVRRVVKRAAADMEALLEPPPPPPVVTQHRAIPLPPVAVALRSVRRIEAQLFLLGAGSDNGVCASDVAKSIGALAAVWAASTDCAPTPWRCRDNVPPPTEEEDIPHTVPPRRDDTQNATTTFQDSPRESSSSENSDDDDGVEGTMFGLPVVDANGQLQMQRRVGPVVVRRQRREGEQPTTARGQLLAELRRAFQTQKREKT